MNLTSEEIDRGAELLCKAALKKSWDELPDDERNGIRMLVTEIANKVDAPRSPEAIAVFMAWMGAESFFIDHTNL